MNKWRASVTDVCVQKIATRRTNGTSWSNDHSWWLPRVHFLHLLHHKWYIWRCITCHLINSHDCISLRVAVSLSQVLVARKQSATCKATSFQSRCQSIALNVSCFRHCLWIFSLKVQFISVDPRSEGWPLVSSPWPVVSILALYVYFVKFFGPEWMKNRPAYDVRAILIAYNIIVAISSAWFFFEGGRVTYFSGNYNLLCQPIDFSPTGDAMRTVEISHRFMLLKMFELLDTVFFILKKNFHQVSNLHVIHHFLVFGGSALGVRIGAGGHGTFLPLINCFVHVIMYTYYCLSAMGPRVHKYLWWKKYLTQLQIAQFIIGGIHAMFPIYFDCGYPKYLSHLILYVTFLFLCLFANFYLKNYLVTHAARLEKVSSSAKDQWTFTTRQDWWSESLTVTWQQVQGDSGYRQINTNGQVNGRPHHRTTVAIHVAWIIRFIGLKLSSEHVECHFFVTVSSSLATWEDNPWNIECRINYCERTLFMDVRMADQCICALLLMLFSS